MWRNGVLGGKPRETMLGNQIHANLEALAAGHGKFVTECLGYGDMQDADVHQDQATGARVPRDIAGYKLYYEYCAFGDLKSAIIRQQNAGQLFHEGFIWMMFEALAECAVAMSQDRIVHSDITTSNSKSSHMFPDISSTDSGNSLAIEQRPPAVQDLANSQGKLNRQMVQLDSGD
jgi:hypothetical protein